MRDNMKQKTGKEIGEWLNLVGQSKLDKHGKIVSFLKSEHSVTHGFANLIAHDFLNQGKAQEVDLVTAQYKGDKEVLKPIYNEIIARLKDLSDLEISPKKTYVSLRHNKQFALIQPSTKTRVDVGINLKGKEATERLENSGSFNAMVSHRVRVTDITQVDEELIGWLKAAYDKS
ncbi:MAG: DUF4287 domain-containing protein [Kangiellaceae bacterium]|nr:DUF4287 domain-containing protein [Kangiellaceae bacterium]MCW8997789.1 DUF4287 domain-containing protein [Kangiellaceae bacterium]MCW9018287.1 DUF4287 domain-containing protein [Kangiellaceae bacterium]